MEIKKPVWRVWTDHNSILWWKKALRIVTCSEGVREGHIKLLSSFLYSSIGAALHDLNPKGKQKAEDPIGEVHTDEPPGTQSGVGKGQRGNQEGAQGMLRKGR